MQDEVTCKKTCVLNEVEIKMSGKLTWLFCLETNSLKKHPDSFGYIKLPTNESGRLLSDGLLQ